MKPVAWIGRFNYMAEIAFSCLQNDEKLHIGSRVFFSQELMTLEESNCQATKTPNRGFVNAINLWVEGLTNFEESHFQAAKITNRSSINTMV
jgi:hypothetical protein